MSIYPKKVTRGENVVIHVRMINFSIVPLPVFLNIYIENSESNYVKKLIKNKLFIIPPQNDKEGGGVIDKYFLFLTNNKNPLGKYNCLTNIILFGKMEKSLTEENDYFFIEKVRIIKEDNFVFLENLSNNSVDIEIYFRNRKVSKNKIKGCSKIKILKEDFVYAQYANGELLF